MKSPLEALEALIRACELYDFNSAGDLPDSIRQAVFEAKTAIDQPRAMRFPQEDAA